MSTVTTPPAVFSPGTPTPALPASGPQPHRWTLDEYHELAKAGLFHDKKTMLIDGELYVMGMPNPPHDVGLTLTFQYVQSVCPSGHHVRNQQGFDVWTRNDPGPDLAVVPGTIRDYTDRTPATAIWIAEISDTTLRIDTTTKVELYAIAQVPEYCVLDVANRRLIVHRDPELQPAGLGANAYRTRLTFGPNDTVAPLAAAGSPVKVAELLP